MTHVCVVHDNIDQVTSIGKLASWAVRTGLEAGWRVTVVARDLDPALQQEVAWRSLYVPPRLHAAQWAAARFTIAYALRGVNPDVLHVYQPQIAALADTWHVEYLSRVGVETDSLERGTDLRSRVTRAQQLAVARMEDSYLRRLGPKPNLLFCSELVQRHFIRLYGEPARHAVLPNPSFSTVGETMPAHVAREALGLPAEAYVVGYLGGVDERKGYRELLQAMTELPEDAVLVMAGPRSEGFGDSRLGGRLRSLGMLSDTSSFWAAIDVLAVPSRFDPFAMVVTEAAVHGTPVVVTPEVGASDLVLSHGAGLVTVPELLGQALREARTRDFQPGALKLAAAVAAASVSTELLMCWEAAAGKKV